MIVNFVQSLAIREFVHRPASRVIYVFTGWRFIMHKEALPSAFTLPFIRNAKFLGYEAEYGNA